MMRGRQTAHVRQFVLFLSDSALFAHIHVQSKNQLIQKHMCNKSVVIDFLFDSKKKKNEKKCLEKNSTRLLINYALCTHTTAKIERGKAALLYF